MRRVLRTGIALLTAVLLASTLVVPGSSHAADAVDFVAVPMLEVTQGVQNMQTPESGKMVPLVAGRRTYVMFYAVGSSASTSAVLRVTWGPGKQDTMLLNPLTNGLVPIGPIMPTRKLGGMGRFMFELPGNRTMGTITLKGIVNPFGKYPTSETNFSNNASNEITVEFVKAATITLDMWDVQYKRLTGKRVYKLADYAPVDHRALAVDWIFRAYPLSGIKYWNHAIYMGKWANISGDLKPLFGSYCEATNWALYDHGWTGSQRYGYGMVAKTGGYMRGCADPFHDVTASGPTGPDGGSGITGDDYAGHELGHLFGRDHAAFCGAGVPKSPFPYPGGSISPVETDQVGSADAIVGFDIISHRTYDYTWRDVMTYCDARWPSDLSYKRFLQRVQVDSAATAQTPANARVNAAAVPSDRLLMRGVIDPVAKIADIRPSFIMTDSLESDRHQPGPYCFVMRDSTGAEIDRYAFTPAGDGGIDQGPAVSNARQEPVEPDQPLAFQELLPYHPATARIDLLGPDNTQLASVSAGTNAPTVTLLTANTLTRVPADQQELHVQWQGADADDDEVHYLLEYSNDDGKTWVQYSDAITETEVTLPQENLMAGARVHLRVLATDGLHTAADTNDVPIVVMNHAPTVRIALPISAALAAPTADPNAATEMTQTTYAAGQTVTMHADAYDVDLGSLDHELSWSSDRDGALQRGRTLSTAELSVGQHTITVHADDGAGGTASDQIAITIVPTMEDLPADPDRLMIADDGRVLSATRKQATTLVVYNQNSQRVLHWNAVVDQPWVHLSASSGATPEQVSLTLKPDHGLTAGTYTATVTLTSPELPHQRERQVITLTVAPAATYLPIVAR